MQDMEGLMVKLNLTERTGNYDVEYYLTGVGLYKISCSDLIKKIQ